MKEVSLRNEFQVKELNKAMERRQKTIQNNQHEQVQLAAIEGETNFIRNQRVQAFNYANQMRKQDDTLEDVIKSAQQIYEFFVADGVYINEERSNIIS